MFQEAGEPRRHTHRRHSVGADQGHGARTGAGRVTGAEQACSTGADRGRGGRYLG